MHDHRLTNTELQFMRSDMRMEMPGHNPRTDLCIELIDMVLEFRRSKLQCDMVDVSSHTQFDYGCVQNGCSADSLRREITRYEKWVADLQAGVYVNCVYCGHRYGREDMPVSVVQAPPNMADLLRTHIEGCPKHPIYALRMELAAGKARDGKKG